MFRVIELKKKFNEEQITIKNEKNKNFDGITAIFRKITFFIDWNQFHIGKNLFWEFKYCTEIIKRQSIVFFTPWIPWNCF